MLISLFVDRNNLIFDEIETQEARPAKLKEYQAFKSVVLQFNKNIGCQMSRNTNEFGSFFPKPINGTYLLRTPSEQTLGTGPKACTPNRPRLIPTAELNGTPISLARKGTSQRIASPLLARINKENQQTNFAHPSPGKLAIKIKPTAGMELQQNRTKSPFLREKASLGTAATLSPLHKLNEGFKGFNAYGLPPACEPTNIDRYSTTGARFDHLQQDDQQALKSSNSFKMLGSRKNSQTSLSPLGLGQKDRSPAHMNEEKKLKHEVIDDIIKNCGKKQQQQMQQQGLRTSNGGNFIAFGQQQKAYSRFESNKFKNAIRESTTHDNFMAAKEDMQMDDGSMMCLNRDGKKAKYRVVNHNPDEDEQPMFYCSKCAIQLIQQGFKVEEIDQQEPRQTQSGSGGAFANKINELTSRLTAKRDRVKKSKEAYTHQFQGDLDQVNTYYDSLISIIEQLRVRDRETVLNHRDLGQQGNDDLVNRLQTGISRLSSLQADCKRRLDHQTSSRLQDELRQISSLCDAPERPMRKEIKVQEHVQDKFDHFVNMLYQQFTLKIEEVNHRDPSPTSQNSTKGAINFSFEKNKANKAGNKKLEGMQPYIKEQSEAEEKYNSIEQPPEERKPFRNLFPDESQPENAVQPCQQQLEPPAGEREVHSNLEPASQEQAGGNLDCYSPSFKNL